MSLLTIVQSHCQRYGLNVPSTVISNTDSTVVQLLSLLNEICDVLSDQTNLQVAQRECTWTYIAAEDQGSIATITGDAGFLYIKNGTMWDRTLGREVYGPLTDIEWQEYKAIPAPGPFYKYRFRGGHLLISPTPTAPLSEIAFEYASSYLIQTAALVPKQYFTVDTDTSAIGDPIFKKGLAYRWKRDKGLEYQADEDEFWAMVNNQVARDGTRRSYNLGRSDVIGVRPGIMVPTGNWNV